MVTKANDGTMENFIKKVIRASAGTGKTYRLSLEYIGLLIKFHQQNVHFKEILVITFTRKATAEIRERIFCHLDEIIYNRKGDRDQLCENLKQYVGIEIGDAERKVLEEIYHEMLLNKNQVHISTIDSFTNLIFKTVISPYLGIMEYSIQSAQDEDVLSEIYETILEEDNFQLLEDFFFRTGRRKISDYKKLIESIINRRWIFRLIEQSPVSREAAAVNSQIANELLDDFRTQMTAILDEFQRYLNSYKSGKLARDVIKKDIFDIIFDKDEAAPVALVQDTFEQKLSDENFLKENSKTILDKKSNPFWKGNRVFGKAQEKPQGEELKKKLNTALERFADWVLVTCALPEEADIREFARRILRKYDEIKFREKVFTYSDISFYTFNYLYQPALSLIDEKNDYVSNLFYEYLSTFVRFILIDEFQDTSIIQFKILLPIIKEIISGYGSKDYGGVIVVGDEKQSIYGWRDGERDLLLKMPEILSEPQQEQLEISYRSEKNIIEFVNDVFSDEEFHYQLQQMDIDWPYAPVSTIKSDPEGFVQVIFRNISKSRDQESDIEAKEGAIREFIEEELVPLLQEEKISYAKTAILARQNEDLQQVANILDEKGIPYISESSLSVIHHRAVRPILYLFKFLVYKDVYNLLSFLRSDLVLMEPSQLKQVVLAYREFSDDEFSIYALLKKNEHLSAISRLLNFLMNNQLIFQEEDSKGKAKTVLVDLVVFTKNVLEEYNVTGIFPLENDIKNINLFLEIIAQFENSNREYSHDLEGFLEYCDKIKDEEEFQQLGLEMVNAVSLMTIHKAKGLEFENVFLFINLSGASGSTHGSICYYPEYERDYSILKNYILTYNFDFVLPLCRYRELAERQRIRDGIEDLNIFYVAATRTKSNLFIYYTYKNKEGLQNLFEKNKAVTQRWKGCPCN